MTDYFSADNMRSIVVEYMRSYDRRVNPPDMIVALEHVLKRRSELEQVRERGRLFRAATYKSMANSYYGRSTPFKRDKGKEIPI